MTDECLKKTALTKDEAVLLLTVYLGQLYENAKLGNVAALNVLIKLEATAEWLNAL